MMLLLGGSSSASQSEFEDVVHMRDGAALRGSILEQIPGESVRLKTAYGDVFVIDMADISKLTIDEEQEAVVEVDDDPPTVSSVKRENWYSYWGLGLANISYTDDLEDMQECKGCDSTSLGVDIFGFYWPLKNERTVVGFVWNFAGEGLEDHVNGVTEFSSSQQLSASAMHFFRRPIGKGPFVRADLGMGRFETQISFPDDRPPPETTGLTTTEGAGLTTMEKYPDVASEELRPVLLRIRRSAALLLGVGYGFPVGSGGTRLLTTLSYAYRPGIQGRYPSTGQKYPEGGVRVLGLTVGGMF